MSGFRYSPIIYRFEKNDILRIVRALAIFRPSLIAMQMPLTEEDEVFVEKCFQRSIIVRLYHPLYNTSQLGCSWRFYTLRSWIN